MTELVGTNERKPKYIARTTIWFETSIKPYKGKYVCQVFDEQHRCTVISGDSFKEVSEKSFEMLYGKENKK